MGAMGRRFLFPSCRLTGAPCEGGSWWWRRREKLRRDGGRDLGRLHGRCALCAPMNSEHSTDADRGLGRRGAGEGGGGGCVDGGWWGGGRVAANCPRMGAARRELPASAYGHGFLGEASHDGQHVFLPFAEARRLTCRYGPPCVGFLFSCLLMVERLLSLNLSMAVRMREEQNRTAARGYHGSRALNPVPASRRGAVTGRGHVKLELSSVPHARPLPLPAAAQRQPIRHAESERMPGGMLGCVDEAMDGDGEGSLGVNCDLERRALTSERD